MKNIMHSTLPKFHGLSSKEPNTFIFEFDVLCKSYNYVSDAHELNLFPNTLKNVSLWWFKGIGGNHINAWAQMKG